MNIQKYWMSKLLHDTISPGTKSDILQAAVVLIIDPTTQKKDSDNTNGFFQEMPFYSYL